MAEVTLFCALLTKSGWNEVAPAFEFLASRFSNGKAFEYEVIGAGRAGTSPTSSATNTRRLP